MFIIPTTKLWLVWLFFQPSGTRLPFHHNIKWNAKDLKNIFGHKATLEDKATTFVSNHRHHLSWFCDLIRAYSQTSLYVVKSPQINWYTVNLGLLGPLKVWGPGAAALFTWLVNLPHPNRDHIPINWWLINLALPYGCVKLCLINTAITSKCRVGDGLPGLNYFMLRQVVRVQRGLSSKPGRPVLTKW